MGNGGLISLNVACNPGHRIRMVCVERDLKISIRSLELTFMYIVYAALVA